MKFLDTCVVRALRSVDDEHHDLVIRWFDVLDHHKVWIAAPVLLELMAACTTAEAADDVHDELSAKFRVRAFDPPAAREAGRVIAAGGGISTLASSAAKPPRSKTQMKQVLRTDAMILGVALAAGDEAELFTFDPDIKKLAAHAKRKGIVQDVPSIAAQGSLRFPEGEPTRRRKG